MPQPDQLLASPLPEPQEASTVSFVHATRSQTIAALMGFLADLARGSPLNFAAEKNDPVS